MTAAIRDFGAYGNLALDLEVDAGADIRRPRNDAQVGVRELEALREVDLVAPPEAADLAEPLVKAFQMPPSSGDHLRLPQLTFNDGATMRQAVARVLSVDTRGTGALSEEQAIKEHRMRAILDSLERTLGNIQRQSAMAVRF